MGVTIQNTCRVQNDGSELASGGEPSFRRNKVQWREWLFGSVTNGRTSASDALDRGVKEGE